MSHQPAAGHPLAELIVELKRLDVKLHLRDGRLHLNAPKGALDAELRAELKARKAELIAFLEDHQQRKTAIPRLPRDGFLLISSAQRRLWFLDRLLPDSTPYHLPVLRELRGPLDVSNLTRAFDRLNERQELLRARFPHVDGRPRLVIDPPREGLLKCVDLQGLDGARQPEEAERGIDREIARAFDLERGLVWRATLFQLSPDRSLLLVVLHHVVADAWSIGILWRELAAFYKAGGNDAALPKLPIQYADFAAWQEKTLCGEAFEKRIDAERQRLAGIAELPFPLDRPRPEPRRLRGRIVRKRLGVDGTAGLQSLAHKHRATLFMTLLTAFAVLLRRWSGQNDLAIGTPVAGRTEPELDGLIGCFVNTLVLRCQISDRLSFVQLLGRVRAEALEVFDRQDIPFERLVEALGENRDLRRNPLFQVVFTLDEESETTTRLGEVSLQTRPFAVRTTHFDLECFAALAGNTLEFGFVYDLDLFDATTVERLSRQFLHLLTVCAEDPSLPLIEFESLETTARHQILVEWNPTERASGPSVPERILRRAKLQPDALALVDAQTQLSHGELDRRSDRLAHRLKAEAVGTEEVGTEAVVALCLERGAPFVISALATWKANGAYLPLDPTHPEAQLLNLLRQARPAVLLTEREGLEGAWQVLAPDAQKASEGPTLDTPFAPQQLAYLIFTSGSAGRPKGVELSHGGLRHLVDWHLRTYALQTEDRAAQTAALSFDAAVWEIWPALAAGSCLCFAQAEARLSPTELLAWLAEERVGIAFLATPLAETLLHEPLPHRLALRALLTGGDRLRARPKAQTFHVPLFNHYGPTENTVVASSARVWASGTGEPTIGRPVEGTRIFLLGCDLRPVPLGSIGEICLSGAALARGYRDRPAETAQAFVPDAFSTSRGERLYRTGDLGRFRADGSLLFVGRRDQQLKILGVRLEPGEIEAVLRQHPEVIDAAVVAVERGGFLRLATFVTGHPDLSELRAFLHQRLPKALVPEQLEKIDTLPLTRHQKVDRKALEKHALNSTSRPLPSQRMSVDERRIAEVWTDLLGRRDIGLDDPFFDLGGHSLLLVRLQQELRRSFERELSILDLFRFPTVRAQATLFETEAAALSSERPRQARTDGDEIAVIGMAGRFPGAEHPDDLWRLLSEGRDALSRFDRATLLDTGVPTDQIDDPRYVPVWGFLPDIELFDPAFFDLTPREAQILDPQQRLFLEVAWEAFEDAAYDPDRLKGAVGVFAGAGANRYQQLLLQNRELVENLGEPRLLLANLGDFLATRVSYKLNLRGPSVAVQSACSTSLLAVHLACRSLRDGECEMALAGGVQLALKRRGYLYESGGILSLDGHCRAFDARATGTVSGSGAAAVLLKPLRQALRDGDHVRAVIRGSAANNDGNVKIGFTAPSVAGQTEVIRQARERAGIEAGSISYIEAHGTGTALGDRIEIAALKETTPRDEQEKPCALGSLKSNIGHLDAAAGASGLIKTVLALEHRRIPPSLHVEEPHPDLSDSGFFVPRELLPWTSDEPRRAGVSSFGLGGTNVHVIVEEAPPRPARETSEKAHLLLLSARTPTALEALSQRLADHLERHPHLDLADVAFSLQVGRRRFDHRRALTCQSLDEAVHALRQNHTSNAPRDLFLQTLAQLWMRGVKIDAALTGEHRGRRIALPTYPFERQRFWVDPPENRRSVAAWFHRPIWQEAAPSAPSDRQGPWLLFADGPLRDTLQALPGERIFVRPGPAFERLSENRFQICPDQAEDYTRLLEALPNPPRRIVHSWLFGLEEDLRTAQRLGYTSLLGLAQTLKSGKVASDASLILLADRLHALPGSEVDPTKSLALGPLMVLSQEFPGFPTRSLDVDASAPESLLQELQHDSTAFRTALRGNRRLVQTYEPTPPPGARRLREGGVYLIVGGLGRLGLRLAAFLAGDVRAKLVLLGRSVGMPKGLDAIRQQTEVMILQADASEADELQRALEVIGARFGRLDGVFHLAADTGEGSGLATPLTQLDGAASERQFRAKVHSLLALDQALADRPLDFRIVFSSLATVLGGPGQAAYAAANHFQSAFAEAGKRWLALEWDAWPGSGGRAETRMSEAESIEALRLALSFDDSAFDDSAFDDSAARILIAVGDLEVRLRRWVNPSLQAQPELRVDAADREEQVRAIWREALGVESIRPEDDFFDLGGDSLIATRVLARMRQLLGIDLTLDVFFEHPTIAELLLQLDGPKPETDLPDSIPRAKDRQQLSFAQARLYFLDRLHPQRREYVLATGWTFADPLDASALRRAWRRIVERHEVLRQRFVASTDGPRVVAEPVSEVPLCEISLLALTPDDQSREAKRFGESAQRPFRLDIAPLSRLLLIREENENTLILGLHHILADGWSLDVLARELGFFYRSEETLPDLPLQYADFAAWQRQQLQGEALEALLAPWRERLEGVEAFELPTDRPRPAALQPRAKSFAFQLDPETSDRLLARAREHQVTPFMLLMAAFQALLYRQTGKRDLVLASPAAGRQRLETEALIGLFVNTLVLRTPIPKRTRFGELCERVKAEVGFAQSFQDLPFETLVEALAPDREFGQPPFSNIFFALQQLASEPLVLGEAEGHPFAPGEATVRIDLEVLLSLGNDGLTAHLLFAPPLFDDTTIARLGRRFRHLLTHLASCSETRLDALEWLDLAEKAQLLREWNDTATTIEEADLRAALQRCSERVPERPAAIAPEGTLSYGALARRVNGLALGLRQEGVGPERIVAVWAERSIGAIEALWAVLEADGAYLHLDPAWPVQRIQATLETVRPVLVLGERPAGLDDPRPWIPLPAAEPVSGPPLVPRPAAHPEELAYIIATSGSTGRPKAVAIPRRGVSNLVHWWQQTFQVQGGESVSHLISPGFDPSVLEIWPTLATGATLRIAPDEVRLSAPALLRWFRDERVVIGGAPTPIIEALHHEPWPNGMAQRFMLTGGERLSGCLESQIGAPFFNCYGPSEVSVQTTMSRVRFDGKTPPIGRPMSNLSLYLTNPRLDLVPLGAVGEISLAGIGVGRGYFERPAWTAERFLPDPFSQGPGKRLYRSGDLGRSRNDGEVEFLGRIDQQVKIRGVRLEPGEVEHLLAQHPAILQAAVVVFERADEKRLAAFVVADAEPNELPTILRQDLAQRLPPAMIPERFELCDALPLTLNQKVDRRALEQRAARVPKPASSGQPLATSLEAEIAEVWRQVLGLEEVDRDANFFDLGGHSLLMLRLQQRLRDLLDHEIAIVDLFRFPTLRSLTHFLRHGGVLETTPRPQPRRIPRNEDASIAIVGMAGRFPGAADLDAFWELLESGRDAIHRFSPEELLDLGLTPEQIADPRHVPAWGRLQDLDLFDAECFNCSPREAQILDPQQRLFLEVAWEALDHAVCDPARFPGLIGVFAGAGRNEYLQHLMSHPDLVATVGEQAMILANQGDFLPSRVAYKFDFKGPSVTVWTACSTSLVALHQAGQSLLAGDCDLALAGGVTLSLKPNGYAYEPGGILSPDGRCRTFDARAAGAVGGSGAACLALKRLDDAERDGDFIHAVIRGSATNNDGSLRAGFTAPSVAGQVAAIHRAQKVAGIDPASIRYLEAHGTATQLGDRIELAALHQVFAEREPRSCALGSVKTQIGHLDTAAGAAGVIKTVLALQRQSIPPSLNYEEPNPALADASSPFEVVTRSIPWPRRPGKPRRAGVSSFGIGGTNAHAVIEEAPVPAERPEPEDRPQLLILSARSTTALDRMTERLAEHLRKRPDLELDDVAFTLQVGRRALEQRRAILTRDRASALDGPRDPARFDGQLNPRFDERRVAFLLPGQGSQRPGMGAALYKAEPVFRQAFDQACDDLPADLREALRRLILHADPTDPEAVAALNPTAYTQPALFMFEYALAQLWISWGVQPVALLGHSVGEYVAACLARVFSLRDGLRLIVERGRLMQSLEPGGMVAVGQGEDEVQHWLNAFPALSLAAINGPTSCVLSGQNEAIAALEARLAGEKIEHRHLATSHAFHSAMMEPILPAFSRLLDEIELRPPEIPLLSNLTGTWMKPEQAQNRDDLLAHLRRTVRFDDGVLKLLARPDVLLLEVGPGRALSQLIRRRGAQVQTSMPHPRKAGDEQVLGCLAKLWTLGVEIDWQAFAERQGRQPRRVVLPSYPFERQRFWVEKRVERPTPVSMKPTGKRASIRDWFYLPTWKRSLLPQPVAARQHPWLLFVADGPGRALAERLQRQGERVLTVEIGSAWQRQGDAFRIDPSRPEDYDRLMAALAEEPPKTILHFWNLTPVETSPSEEALRQQGYYSLLFLGQALAAQQLEEGVFLLAICNRLWAVDETEKVEPEKATLLGPLQVLPQEYPGLTASSVDVLWPASEKPLDGLLDQLEAEARARRSEGAVALRGRRRWLRAFEPLTVETSSPLQEGGVYLITGGSGRIGLQLASLLHQRFQARLALLGRTPLDELPNDRKEKVQELETEGADLLLLSADVADPEALRLALTSVVERFGRLDGILHAAGALKGAEDGSSTPLPQLDRERSEAQFRPKIAGLYALEQALEDGLVDIPAEQQPSFCMIFSSLAALLGGLGFAAYSAANSFQDAFARSRRSGSFPWISVNWDGWPLEEDPTEAPVATRFEMSRAESDEAFLRALSLVSSDFEQLVVSTGDLDDRLERWIWRRTESRSRDEKETVDALALPQRDRPNRTEFEATRDEIEQGIAEIWGDALGLDRVGRLDDFFELGGDSLMGTQVLSLLRRHFQTDLTLDLLFEASTVEALASHLRKESAPKATAPTIPRLADDRREFPLSFSQLRQWVLSALEPSSSGYNLFAPIRLRGALDAGRLAEALTRIVKRHGILRTTFHAGEGEPFQRLHEAVERPLVILDWRSLTARDRARFEPALVRIEAGRLFDFARGGLFRALLVLCQEEEHLLFMSFHHMIYDGWSSRVFYRELSAAYLGQPLPEPPIQYADFAAWQRQFLSGDVFEDLVSYWRNELGDAPTVLDLPTDRPRPAVRRGAGALVSFSLKVETGRRLQTLSRQHQASLFMVLLTLLQVLLHRLTGQTDLLIGTYIANRNRAETADLIGFFVNTLVLRGWVRPGSTPSDILNRSRETALATYAHQDMPFEKLLDVLEPVRDPSRTPLFQTLLLLQNTPDSTPRLADFEVEFLERTASRAEFDLKWTFFEVDERLIGHLEFDRDLFDSTTAQRLCRAFQHLAQILTERPEAPLASLPLLPEMEQHQLLREGSPAVSHDLNLGELLHPAASQKPEKIALVGTREEHLSYAFTNQRVERASQVLLARGVGVESRVALAGPRDLHWILNVLAVLRAGAAFLPLDFEHPPARLETLLRDARVELLLAIPGTGFDVEAAPTLAARADLPLLTPRELRAGAPASTPPSPPDLALAFVIFTSGTTGRPRGISISHQALAAFVRTACELYRFGASDRVLQFALPSFDTFCEEVFPTLAVGATLVLRPASRILNVDAFADLADRQRISVLDLPTAYWHELTTQGYRPSPSLRLMIVGGEKAERAALERWRQLAPKHLQLMNGYGPSEATVIATVGTVARQDSREVTIGRAIPGAQVLLLGPALGLVPAGARGEIAIAGTGLARGYLDRPGRTAERFPPHPWADGERLYLSGDLARLRQDGQLEFLGRRDDQVKIRGKRVEPGEVAALLRQHPEVEQAVVLARPLAAGQLALVAFLVIRAAAPQTEKRLDLLRDFLREHLPEQAIPVAFERLDALPLTRRQKVDRQALLQRPLAAIAGPLKREAPKSELEQRLAQIWAEVLGLEKVGVTANFFDLGGDSLLILRLHRRLEEELDLRLTVLDLFRYPSVRALAPKLKQQLAPQPEAEAPAASATYERAKALVTQQKQARRRRRPGARRSPQPPRRPLAPAKKD